MANSYYQTLDSQMDPAYKAGIAACNTNHDGQSCKDFESQQLNAFTGNLYGVTQESIQQIQMISALDNSLQLGMDETQANAMQLYLAANILTNYLTFGSASLEDLRSASMLYAQTYANINAKNNPGEFLSPQYLQNAFNPEGLLVSANAGVMSTGLVTSVASNPLLGKSAFTPENIANMPVSSTVYSLTDGKIVTLYKGIQNFDPSLNGILPGGLAPTTNSGINITGEQITYRAGSGITDASKEEIITHTLLGDTSNSAYSSWTTNITTAKKYAGSDGVIVSTSVPKSEGTWMNQVFNKETLDPNPDWSSAYNNAINNEIQRVMQTQNVSYGTASQILQQYIAPNLRNFANSNEVLLQGVIQNFQIIN
jgi:hypothetical protein